MRNPAPSADPADAGADAGLSVELASAVAAARRRAVRDGDRQIDTAHLLHSLLESDHEVRAAFAGGPSQVARLLGYLVQRTIGYGLRWSGTVEDSGALPLSLTRAGGRGAAGPGADRWSPAAASAMESALARARRRGAGRAAPLDLLVAIARDHECRAVEVLRRAGVDPDLLIAELDGQVCQQSTG